MQAVRDGRRPGRLSRGSGFLVAALVVALLPACQSGSGSKGRSAASEFAGPMVPAPPEATQPAAPTVAAADASFRFDQILGVPTGKQDTLARGLAEAARSRNLKLVRRSDPNAPYRVLGYLSAVGGDAGVNVTYVWDIVDAGNNRVHRFAGIEIAGTTDADPWAAVTDQTLDAISKRTVEDIYAWINRLPAPAAAAATAGSPSAASSPAPATL